jgi:hypothetical protein
MNPKIWGPHAWIFLHTITLGYPKNPTEQDKETYKNFFLSLQGVLPCKKCNYYYKNNIRDLDITNHLDSKESLVKWLISIHNKVNKENNKSIVEYSDVIKKYKELYNISDTNNFNKNVTELTNNKIDNKYLLIITIVLSILLGYYYYKKYYN